MSLNKTMELTRGELGLMAVALVREWHRTGQLEDEGNRDGWYDTKSKERVTVHLHETEKLIQRVNLAIKELDDG
jgi:hypothetical protein